jgi:alanine racemase
MIIQPYAWIEIDEGAVRHNAALFKSLIGPTSALAPVIKSNAYGHGIAPISRLMDSIDAIDWLCVGYLSEALTIRAAGVRKPILVMSCIDDDPAKAAHLNVHFVIGDMQKLASLYAASLQHGVTFDIHLKVDTGLSRFGILPEDALQLITSIKTMRGVNLSGICTHFVESYKDDQSFTQSQINSFAQVVASLDAKPSWIHACNSAGTVAAEVPHANLFRVGLGMYGYWSSAFIERTAKTKLKRADLKPVLTFKTRIMEVKNVKKGATIGYDRTYTAHENMRIGLLPIGYYDGYDFRLCNNSLVYIDGKPYPLVGKVAMNTIAIDITRSPQLLIGSEVIVIGDKPGIAAPAIAGRIGEANPRKVLTSLAAHLPRIVV